MTQTQRANEYYRQLRVRLIREFGGRCERCRTREKLEFAHVEHTPVCDISRGRGRNDRIRDVAKNPSAFALLCSGCHDAFDRGAFKVRGFECFRKGRYRNADLGVESRAAEGF